MTLALSTRSAGPFTATAAQTDFPADFPALNTAAIGVSRVRDGVATVLDPSAWSIVSPTDDSFTLRLAAGAMAGDEIFIYSAIPPQRDIAYGSLVRASTADDELQLVYALLQELTRDGARGLRVPIDETLTELPRKADRAGGRLGFDSNGDPAVLSDAGVDLISLAMLPVVQAASAWAARKLLERGNTWADIASAATLNLAAQTSARLRITGSTQINSFGTCDASDLPVLLRAAAAVMIGDENEGSGGNITGSNGGHACWMQPGDLGVAYPLGGDQWYFQWFPANALLFMQQSTSGGEGNYRISAVDSALTLAPGFAYNGGDGLGKFYCHAIFVTAPTNGPQYGGQMGRGTNAVPVRAETGDITHYYAWAFNDDQSRDTTYGLQAMADTGGLNHNQYFDYIGRLGYMIIQAQEPSTVVARGGNVLLCSTPTGKVSSFAGAWLSAAGNWCVAGGGRFEDGTWDYTSSAVTGAAVYPFAEIDAPGRRFSPGGFNPIDNQGDGAITISASPKASRAVISVQEYGNWGQKGYKFGWDSAGHELNLGPVVGGVTTYTLAFSTAGDLLPVSGQSPNLGTSSRRLGGVAIGAQLDVARTNDSTLASLVDTATSYTSDVLSLNSAATGGGGNLIKAVVNGSHVWRVDLSGKTFQNGGAQSSGAGFTEWREWADGNPAGEDRSGWTVRFSAEVGKTHMVVRASDPAARGPVIGVVSRRGAFAGNGADGRWRHAHLRDAFGRVLTEDVEHVAWTETPKVTHQVERRRMVERVVTRTKSELRPIAETEHRHELGEDGKWVRRPVTVTRPELRPVSETVPLHHHETGAALIDPKTGVQLTAEVPVMETVTIQEPETYTEDVVVDGPPIHHHYRADQLPAGVTPPADARRFTAAAPRENPSWVPDRPYTPPEARPEWDEVSHLGAEYVLEGELVPEGWVWMRQSSVSPPVHEYLVAGFGPGTLRAAAPA